MSIFARREMVLSGYVAAAAATGFGLYHLFVRHELYHAWLGYVLVAVGVVMFSAASFARTHHSGLNPLRLLIAMLIAAILLAGLFQDAAERLL